MTPQQERALLDATAAGLDDELRDAYHAMVQRIRDGVAPRDAVQQAMDAFTGDMASTMSTALSAIMDAAVGTEAVQALEVGTISLSRRLYAEAASVSATVESIVAKHAAGFSDSRALALRLFEGYTFRDPAEEPLQFNPREPRLPKYMREALIPDTGLQRGFERAYAGLQVDGLKTGPLRAAYSGALEAIDGLEGGRGATVLENKLRVAFYERVRYFSTRIAITELHRAAIRREALLIADDPTTLYVEVKRAPGGEPCICVLYAGRDRYGLGAGVYPKAQAPLPPYHPYCRCILSPRPDLSARKPIDDAGADAYFLRRLNEPLAGRIMGSQAKLGRVLTGQSADSVHNASLPPEYKIRTLGA